MKHIVFDERLGWDHRPYFSYLETVKSQMTENIYEFAANPDHHNLTSHRSMHDAWLENISVSEVSDLKNKKSRHIGISTSYLGPFHDQRILISYSQVSAYDLKKPTVSPNFPSVQKSHGDLLVHEVRIAGEDLYEHEIEFSGGAVFLIQFRTLDYIVQAIELSR